MQKEKIKNNSLFSFVLILSLIAAILTSFLLCIAMNPSYALTTLDPPPLDYKYNLTIDGNTYPLSYGFSLGSGGTLDSMYSNSTSKSITIIIENRNSSIDWKDRLFSVELPRKIIDANTTEITGGCSQSEGARTIWTQQHDVEYIIDVHTVGEVDAPAVRYSPHYTEEICGLDSRKLTIDYPVGKTMIVIQGTVMIPEFNSVLLVLVAEINASTIVIACTGRK